MHESTIFELKIEPPSNYRTITGVERAVHHCLIHNTLLHSPKIAIDVKERAFAHQ